MRYSGNPFDLLLTDTAFWLGFNAFLEYISMFLLLGHSSAIFKGNESYLNKYRLHFSVNVPSTQLYCLYV